MQAAHTISKLAALQVWTFGRLVMAGEFNEAQ
jgi:hypothetical protein